MSQTTQIQNLATEMATAVKAVKTLMNGNAADLSALTTTTKTSLLAAVNELKAAIDAAVASSGAVIDDASTSSTTKTYSITKIRDLVSTSIAALTNGAPTALDTLDELAAALGDDANFAATMTTALGNRVRTDTASQGLTSTQQANARTNIGAVSTTDIGDTNTDFAAIFNAGLI